MRDRAAFGDFQTPEPLAARVMECLGARLAALAPTGRLEVVEPTVGRGAFLVAAARALPRATLFGLERDPGHLEVCRTALASAQDAGRCRLALGDVFAFDFDALAAEGEGPVLLLGNPPWVTSAAMPRLGGSNLPTKRAVAGQRGLDARTGAANFDVAEWILGRLFHAFARRRFLAAFLVKTQVARRLVARIATEGWPLEALAMHGIDARAAFGATVDACLFVAEGNGRGAVRGAGKGGVEGAREAAIDVASYASLAKDAACTRIGVREGTLVADLDAYARAQPSLGRARIPFRSGVKHDAGAVLELVRRDDAWCNGLGETVAIEEDCLHPLVKGGDLDRARPPRRALVLAQRAFGEDTGWLVEGAPRTHAYLLRHAERLDARRSSIYRGAPRFAVFGLGPYSFAPYKVAVFGMAKAPRFHLVRPQEGRPTMLDDTCYFVAFDDEASAEEALAKLRGPQAEDVLRAFLFVDQKRPLTKATLMRLDLERLRP